FSPRVVPRHGGLDDSGFDSADVPLNARLAINPNTDQVVLIFTQPLADYDLYVFGIDRPMAAANPDGSPNPADPLTDPTGLPLYPPPFLVQSGGSGRAAVAAGSLGSEQVRTAGGGAAGLRRLGRHPAGGVAHD